MTNYFAKKSTANTMTYYFKFFTSYCILITFLISLCTGCASKVEGLPIELKLLDFGLVTADGKFEPVGFIPAKLGAQFGIHFLVEASELRKPTLEAVVIFPGEGYRPQGSKYAIKLHTEIYESSIGSQHKHTYVLDDASKLLPGEWVFQVRLRNSVLIEQTLIVK